MQNKIKKAISVATLSTFLAFSGFGFMPTEAEAAPLGSEPSRVELRGGGWHEPPRPHHARRPPRHHHGPQRHHGDKHHKNRAKGAFILGAILGAVAGANANN